MDDENNFVGVSGWSARVVANSSNQQKAKRKVIFVPMKSTTIGLEGPKGAKASARVR